MNALRIDFRTISYKCHVCEQPAVVMRIVQAMDGEVYTETSCTEHAQEEQREIIDEGVLQQVEDTTTYINQDLYDKLQNLDAMDEIQDAIEGG